MKKILFAIALILFGFNCTYVGVQMGLNAVGIIGIIFSIVGLAVAIDGAIDKEK